MSDEEKTLEETAEDTPSVTPEDGGGAAADPVLNADLTKVVDDLTRQLGERDAKMGELQAEISEKGALVESQSQELAILQAAGSESESKLAGLAESLTDAIKRYRDFALVTVPDAVADLVVGDTIDAIDASLAGAKLLVDKVKQGLAASASEIISSGSPERTGEDWRDKSPKEKIAHGLDL